MQDKTDALENGLTIKKTQALRRLRECPSVLVALSGGVDSAVLLALAVEALGPQRVLAVTGISGSLPSGELDEARAIARSVGVAHEVVTTQEMEREQYRANTGDRCFHCRSELFEVLHRLARDRGFSHVAYGAIAEDASDFRPGMRAAEEMQILAPLLESGIGKPEVRALADQAGLSVREKPASACLASRIPIGTEVTRERLTEVDRAEAELRRLGYRQLRVRHHGEVARLELDDEGFLRLSDAAARAAVVDAVRRAGFRYVAVDLEGYRSGSMNPEGPTLHRIGPARDSGQ